MVPVTTNQISMMINFGGTVSSTGRVSLGSANENAEVFLFFWSNHETREKRPKGASTSIPSGKLT